MVKGKFTSKIQILIIMSLVFSLILTGCGNDNAADKPTSTVKPGESATTAPKKEPAELNIFSVDNPVIQKNYDQNLPVFVEIGNALNVKFKWQLMPSAGYEDALNIKLSAGVDMPDIFGSWQQNPEELGKNGAVIALSDYFDTTMKNVKLAIDNDSGLKSAVTSPDGKVYFLPSKGTSPNLGWLIRQDWLDKLGLSVPETIDEFYNVLKAFKELDPNGNGKQDEVPLAQNYVNYVWFYMMHAFGLNTAVPWDYLGQDSNGKFYSYLTRPEFKETMGFVSKLYKEKLMNQDILNVSGEAYLKLITENKVGVVFDQISPEYLVKIKEANPNTDPQWTVMLPPKGPRGDRGVRSYSGIDGMFFIAKNGKNIDDATRFMDYIFADPEGSALINWGIKGISYEEENGVKKSTDFVLNNPEGFTPMDALRSLGALPILPKIIDPAAQAKIVEVQNKDNPWITAGIELYAKEKVVGEPEKRYRFTSEEASQISEIQTELGTYISEVLAKILVGNTPIDEFDNFVKTLNDKGIDRMVQIYQKVEDRSK